MPNYQIDSLITTAEGKTGTSTGFATAVLNFMRAFKSNATNAAQIATVTLYSSSSGRDILSSWGSVTLSKPVTDFRLLTISYYNVENGVTYDHWLTVPSSAISVAGTFKVKLYHRSATDYLGLEFDNGSSNSIFRFRFFKGTGGTGVNIIKLKLVLGL